MGSDSAFREPFYGSNEVGITKTKRPDVEGIKKELDNLQIKVPEAFEGTVKVMNDLCDYILHLEAQNAPYITKDEEGCEEEHHRPSAEHHYHIKEALRMQEGRATMFQTQLIDAAIDAQDIEILEKEVFKLQGMIKTMQEALKRADLFITNGTEFGYISYPDPGSNDPAWETPGIVRNALAMFKAGETDFQYSRWNRLRPQVQEFANVMEDVLRKNDYKRGWKCLEPRALLSMLLEETGELVEMCCMPKRDGYYLYSLLHLAKQIALESTWDKSVDRGFYDPEKVIKEAADIVNFCMMIADNCKTILDQKAQDDAGC